MSCCPSTPSPQANGSADSDAPAQSTDIRKGETMDCYMRRSGNTTGMQDDKTDFEPNKISTSDIPLTPSAGVDAGFKFELTPGPTYTGVVWTFSPASMVGITFNTSTGQMSGTFDAQYHGSKQELTVTVKGKSSKKADGSDASPAADFEDSRKFVFSPSLVKGSDTISFVPPLPGSVVTSKFGPRRPPASGASSQHGGADFAIPGRKIGDVVAGADGIVEFTGYQAGGAGNYIKIKHLNGSNKHLCTTVYMHLDKIYVAVGQTVIAGQKVGLEGNTGVGTGAHLHFECRLPDGTKIDPVPLINGKLTVSQQTTADNQPAGEQREQNSSAVLTPSNVDAREQNCPPPEEYPKGEGTDAAPTPPGGNVWDAAWFFTMTHEVGPFWTKEYPNDPEVRDGLIETAAQRKKCGYVQIPGDTGGVTKFGVAQNSNPSVRVSALKYADAQNIGYNNYWTKGGTTPKAVADRGQPKTAIVLFDSTYLQGAGGAGTVYRNSGITASTPDDEAMNKLCDAREQFFRDLIAKNPARQKFERGWMKRIAECRAYAKSYTP